VSKVLGFIRRRELLSFFVLAFMISWPVWIDAGLRTLIIPISGLAGGNDRIYNRVNLKTADGKVLFGGRATLRVDGHYIV